MELNFRLPFRPTLFLIPILILAACVPAAPVGLAQPPDRQVQASPTTPGSAAIAPSTEVPGQPASTQTPSEARLAVVTSRAKVLAREGVETEVQQAQAVSIQLGNRIEVAKLDGQAEQSHSILHFPDYLNVELFSNTSVLLADVKKRAGGSTAVTLELNRGHMFVHLNDQTITQVTVWTPYAIIKTLTDGTVFDVCRNEELTCVVVKRGVVELTAQGRREIVRAGAASYVLKDQPPSAAICAPAQTFTNWEESFRRSADAPALDVRVSELPQEACPLTAEGIPLNARILYRDEFTDPSSKWDQGKSENFNVRYAGGQYYRVQVQGPRDLYLAFVPNGQDYDNVNIDIRAIAEEAAGGDLRYGLVFRRSGDQFYAFAVSPVTKTWYFLKSSPDGLETLKEGKDDRMRGLEVREALRVEADGPMFLLYINDRFIDLVRDSDYTRGEAGLFVETINSPDALIRFDSILIWDVSSAPFIPNTGGREFCFNGSDDDGDGWTDRADPDCQRPGVILTSPPISAPLLTSTLTSQPTNTRRPPSTFTPQPTTITPKPTNTRRPTSTPQPTTPGPTNTRKPSKTPNPSSTPMPPTTEPPPPTTEPPPPTTEPPPPTTEPPPPTATEPPTISFSLEVAGLHWTVNWAYMEQRSIWKSRQRNHP